MNQCIFYALLTSPRLAASWTALIHSGPARHLVYSRFFDSMVAMILGAQTDEQQNCAQRAKD